jgi:hypothetical protein
LTVVWLAWCAINVSGVTAINKLMTPSKTVCLGCNQSVEFVTTPDGRSHCPQCGAPFAELMARSRINWFLFLVVLLAPALVATLGAQIKSDDLAVG